MLDPKLKKRLHKEVRQSGYPLELDVINKLRDDKFIVSPNLNFSTPHHAIREIDAIAYCPTESDQDWPYGPVGGVLVVECKRSREKPWVLFEEAHDPLAALGLGARAEVVTHLSYHSPYGVMAACMNSPLGDHHFNRYSIPRSRTYFEAFKKPNQNCTIYKAVESVWYGLNFYREWFQRMDQSYQKNERQPYSERRTNLLQGAIVLDGELVIATMEEDDFEVRRVDHVVLRTVDCLTNSDASPFPTDNEILIDVIRSEYLADYLETTKQNVHRLQKHLVLHHQSGWITSAVQSI